MVPKPDCNEKFIDLPDVSHSALFLVELLGVFGSELPALMSNRLIRDGDTTLGKQIFNIREAEHKSVIQPHYLTDGFWWKALTFVTDNHSLIVIDHADFALT